MDTMAMNKIVSEEEWVKDRKALLKKDSSHPDSDEDENEQTVTRIFHGLYVLTTKRY
jgi:hypothetical protein